MNNDIGNASFYLEKSKKLRPNSPSVLWNEIRILLKKKNYNKALKYFHKSQKLSESDSVSKYSLLMVSAFQKFSSGKKEVLWDAIQSFYKASNIYPLNGEPHYYIGETYLKLGDKDFDLIIDSYDKALSLNLPEPLEEKVKTSKKEALRRRDLLKNFWK